MYRLLYLLLCLPGLCWGHGRLMDPPSRSSLWRFGFDNPPNYGDNELFCGGFDYQWNSQGGNCGVCGDKWDGPWDNEAGGIYANGIISQTYAPSDVIDVEVEVTANHWGWFEFRLCPNDPNERFTHECLDQYLLELADGSGTRYHLESKDNGFYTIPVRLPAGLFCPFCTLQWKYNTGNSWGRDPDTGEECVGCGRQEQFYGCSDIAIGDNFTPGTPGTPPTNIPTDDPTPSPWPTDIPGVDCEAIGDWEGVPGMREWCMTNCGHVPPVCPSETCRCWRNPPPDRT